MVVRGFLQGLHSSPFHGFSVQFSEHRRYNRGDDPKLIDWLVYAKTDKYYVKRLRVGNESDRLPGHGFVEVDGLYRKPIDDQVRVLHLPGRVADVLDDDAARSGRPDLVRLKRCGHCCRHEVVADIWAT